MTDLVQGRFQAGGRGLAQQVHHAPEQGQIAVEMADDVAGQDLPVSHGRHVNPVEPEQFAFELPLALVAEFLPVDRQLREPVLAVKGVVQQLEVEKFQGKDVHRAAM